MRLTKSSIGSILFITFISAVLFRFSGTPVMNTIFVVFALEVLFRLSAILKEQATQTDILHVAYRKEIEQATKEYELNKVGNE